MKKNRKKQIDNKLRDDWNNTKQKNKEECKNNTNEVKWNKINFYNK
jgi:hypothetical protein